MKTPSRRMPQAMPVRSGPLRRALGWAMLSGLIALLAYFLWHVWQRSTLLGAALALYFLAAPLSSHRQKCHLRKLAAERAGESLCTFARAFDCRHVDTWVIRAVYEQVASHLAMPGFPLRPQDNLGKTLNLDGDDLDFDIAPQIAERTNRTLANAEDNPYFNKVHTAADLVLFFNAQALQSESNIH